MVLQTAVLAVGAYLVVQGRMMFATFILASHAWALVELAIVRWRGFVGAAESVPPQGPLRQAVDGSPYKGKCDPCSQVVLFFWTRTADGQEA
jgi:hypothetical protein